MTDRFQWVFLFEMLVLTNLVLLGVRRDSLTALVMREARGVRANRVFRVALLAIALVGGVCIALVPDDTMFSWLLPALTVLAGVPAPLLLRWQRRAVLSLDAERTSRDAVLDLADESWPRTMWLAAPAPLMTVGLVYVLAAQWGSLVQRDPSPVPAATVWLDPAFRGLVGILGIGLVWNVWFGVLGLAMWYGVSRQYAFRRSQVSAAVATSWFQTLTTPAWTLPLWLRLPPGGLMLCAISFATGVTLLVVYGRRARRDWQAANMPPSSYGFYFDRDDPSAFGDRGTNLGSPWNWALFAAPALFLALPLLSFW